MNYRVITYRPTWLAQDQIDLEPFEPDETTAKRRPVEAANNRAMCHSPVIHECAPRARDNTPIKSHNNEFVSYVGSNLHRKQKSLQMKFDQLLTKPYEFLSQKIKLTLQNKKNELTSFSRTLCIKLPFLLEK